MDDPPERLCAACCIRLKIGQSLSPSCSSLWGRPTSWHMTPGCEFDWMLLAAAPNEGVVATAGLVATGGRAQDTKVSRARTPRRNCEDLRTDRSWRVSRKRLG